VDATRSFCTVNPPVPLPTMPLAAFNVDRIELIDRELVLPEDDGAGPELQSSERARPRAHDSGGCRIVEKQGSRGDRHRAAVIVKPRICPA
jgi:hypothetical protein